jgi:Fic family protein
VTIEFSDNDPERTFSEEEQHQLSRHLYSAAEDLRKRASQRPYSLDLLRQWHYTIFAGVRNHAGKFRGDGFGDEMLVFGPNRSAHRDNVHNEMEAHIRKANRMADHIRGLPRDTDPADYGELVIETALQIHADLIRIHPFQDGNGRVGRLAMNYWLQGFGIRWLAIETVREEYIDAMNAHFAGESQPLLLLAARLFRNQNNATT